MRLVISCPDRPGIVAAVSRFLFEEGANVISLDQFSSDPLDARHLLPTDGVHAAAGAHRGLPERFGLAVAERWHMTWRMWSAERPKRIAVLLSREDHCLQELLWRWRRHELSGEIVLVASNHPDHREAVEGYGLPYHHVPVTKEGGKADIRGAAAGAVCTDSATSSCWRGTCRSCPASSSSASRCR